MLTEILILDALMGEECTIYKIKKKTDKYFFLFCRTSMASIHPALKKLYSEKHVSLKTLMSSGGQKSSKYSVTNEGKKYFEQLMLQLLPENPAMAEQIIAVKLILLPKLAESLRKNVISHIKVYYQSRLLDFENFQENRKVYKDLELKDINSNYIKHCINKLSEDINWLKMQEFI